MTAVATFFLSAVICQLDNNATLPAADETLQLQFLKEQAATLIVKRSDAARSPLAMTADPVLRYSNPLGGGQAGSGATFLWLDRTKPLAAVSLSIRASDHHAYIEGTSLSAEPLECLRSEALFWSPTTRGQPAQRLDDASPPAESKALRLSQMREIARRFSAATFTQAGARTELRLMSTPVYRFSDEASGVLDGALFAFAVSNDPELLILLEAVHSAGGNAAHWQYSLARMSSRKEVVQLDEREVWSVENFYSLPAEARKTGRYLEARLGKFDPNVIGQSPK